MAKSRQRTEVSCTDPCLFSPKAPRCSSRWEELLKLKKLYQSKGKYGPAFMNLWKSLLSSHRLMHLASVDQFSAEFCSFISACIQKGPDDRKISTMGLPTGASSRSQTLLVCPSLYPYLLTRMPLERFQTRRFSRL